MAEKLVEAETPVESPKKQKKKHVRKQKKQPEAIAEPKTEAVNDDFTDSAFGPDIPEINISNEALAASVREAEAMGAAIMGDLKAAKVPVETMFGINEELSPMVLRRINVQNPRLQVTRISIGITKRMQQNVQRAVRSKHIIIILILQMTVSRICW